jgi:hypothetical protein
MTAGKTAEFSVMRVAPKGGPGAHCIAICGMGLMGIVLAGIGLVAVARSLRYYRFNERLLLRLIVLAAVTRLAWKALNRAFARWIAWEDAEELFEGAPGSE